MSYNSGVIRYRPILAGLLGGLAAVGVLLLAHALLTRRPTRTPKQNPRAKNLLRAQPRPGREPVSSDPNEPVFTSLQLAGQDGDVTFRPRAGEGDVQAPQTDPLPPRPAPATRSATTDAPESQPSTTPGGPTGLDGQLRRADRALAAGQSDEAVALYRAATGDHPRALDAWRGLAMALQASERYDEAIVVYRKLLDLGDEQPATRHNLALALAREGEFYEAEREYLELIRSQPDYKDAQVNLAMLYQLRGKLADAAERWRAVLRRWPDHVEAHASLGEVLMDLGQAEGAMDHYAEAAKLRPKRAGYWLNFAAAACRAGSGGRAITALDRAITLGPYDAEAWRMRGDILLELYRSTEQQDLLDQAVAAWRRSLELDDNQPSLRDLLTTYGPMATSRPAEPDSE